MYWTESWKDQPATNPVSRDGGEPQTRSGGNDRLLNEIIKKNDAPAAPIRPLRVDFPTAAFESRFKSCLAQVPVSARVVRKGRRRALLLRPQNVRQFEDLIRTSGLANCEAAIKSVEWLKNNADGFLRYETR